MLPQNGDGVARFNGATSGGTVALDSMVSVEEVDFDNSGGGGYTLAALAGRGVTLSTPDGAAGEEPDRRPFRQPHDFRRAGPGSGGKPHEM